MMAESPLTPRGKESIPLDPLRPRAASYTRVSLIIYIYLYTLIFQLRAMASNLKMSILFEKTQRAMVG